MGCQGSRVAYIFRKVLECNYAKFGPNRSKDLEVNREHADGHSIFHRQIDMH